MDAEIDSLASVNPRHRDVEATLLSQEQFNRILCPNLRIGVRMSLLEPDAEGWVLKSQLRDFLQFLGVPRQSLVGKGLISSAYTACATQRRGFVNILDLDASRLNHGSSSGILNNATQQFSAERLALLKGYLNSEGRMYVGDIAPALNFFHRCPFHRKSTKGTHLLSFEFAGLLALYGRKDSVSGKSYFTAEDIDDIWFHNRFPSDWVAPNVATFGTRPALQRLLAMMLARVFTRWRKPNITSTSQNSNAIQTHVASDIRSVEPKQVKVKQVERQKEPSL